MRYCEQDRGVSEERSVRERERERGSGRKRG